MRRGKRLGIDVGSVRIGLASCDADGILSIPLPALKRSADSAEVISEINRLVDDLEILEVVIGDPISMSGNITQSTSDARKLASEIAAAIAVPVRL